MASSLEHPTAIYCHYCRRTELLQFFSSRNKHTLQFAHDNSSLFCPGLLVYLSHLWERLSYNLTLGCFSYNLNDYWDRKLLRNTVTASCAVHMSAHCCWLGQLLHCCNALFLWGLPLFFKLLLTWAFSNWQLWFFPFLWKKETLCWFIEPSFLSFYSFISYECEQR